MIGLVCRSIQMMLMDLNMKVNLVKQSVGISLLLSQALKLFMATMPNQEELRQQIESKDWENLLTKVPVRAGDFFYVPSGTMHAIGAGIMVLETQQSSDTTYRVYDFDRKDDQGNLRELHLEKSIDVLNIGEPANSRPVTTKVDDLKSTLLVAGDFFAVYKWKISGKADFEKTADYSLFSVLDGQGSLLVDDQEYPIAKGSHFILPSDVEAWQIKGNLELIVSHP